jgi:tRNA(fMet)-specific endonuclease VapC
MNYLFDTNILLHLIRDSQQYKDWNQTHNFFRKDNNVITSIVSIGEVESLAHQLNWGDVKRQKLSNILRQVKILGINNKVVSAYARTDAYSQNKLLNHPLPTGLTARNMGKNNVWLAATAHVTNLKFVTTDHDFIHLDNIYIDLLQL